MVAVTNAFLPLLRAADAARIVNLSSEVASLPAMLDDPDSPMYHYITELPYPASKTALNMVTGQHAKELSDTPIKVSGAIPGYTATDLNDNTGHRAPAQAAEIISTLATCSQTPRPVSTGAR